MAAYTYVDHKFDVVVVGADCCGKEGVEEEAHQLDAFGVNVVLDDDLHMLGGIRHFIWDTGAALEKHTASKLAWATVVGSVVLTIAVWVVGLMVRGGWA